jgi:solute carrier family 13 (sodium-dependent dicarboxylate transporter), member 2/3/5
MSVQKARTPSVVLVHPTRCAPRFHPITFVLRITHARPPLRYILRQLHPAATPPRAASPLPPSSRAARAVRSPPVHQTTHNHEPGVRWVRIALGPIIAALVYVIIHHVAPALDPKAALTAAAGAWIATWWVLEALPLEATGLLPIVLFPALGIGTLAQTCAPYANEVIFLFLGGMTLGVGLERSGLHRRFGLAVVALVGVGPARLVGGFLLATTLLSMWVSNAAATIMMMPIALAACSLLDEEGQADTDDARSRRTNLEAAMMLAVAFGASIGGIGTLIGTPPMAQMSVFLKSELGLEMSFASWFKVSIPVLLVMVPAAWLSLAFFSFKLPRTSHTAQDGTQNREQNRAQNTSRVRDLIAQHRAALGPWAWREWTVALIFAAAVLAWVTKPLHNIPDAIVSITAALLLFLLPDQPRARTRAVLTWEDAAKVPWGVLIMFGGGLTLAEAITRNKLDVAIADAAGGLHGASLLTVLLIVGVVTILLTEVASNTALTAAGLPILAALCKALDIPPVPALVTLALVASLGFMMPAGTPPNAIVFASKRVTIRQMMRAGVALDLFVALTIPLLVYAAYRMGLLPG